MPPLQPVTCSVCTSQIEKLVIRLNSYTMPNVQYVISPDPLCNCVCLVPDKIMLECLPCYFRHADGAVHELNMMRPCNNNHEYKGL